MTRAFDAPRAVSCALAMMATLLLAGVGAAAAPPSRGAQARSTKQACVDAATRGQIQRDDGKLGAAAEAFEACTDAACPAAVRQSCVEWLEDVRAKIPELTVRLEAPVPSATVRVDGAAAEPDTTLTLEPGQHVVRAEAEGKQTFVEELTLAPGDKKTVVVRFEDPPVPPPKPTVRRPVPLSVWILGGVGVVGFAGFATFGLIAKSETDRLLADCAPGCETSERDAAFRSALIADVALGVGVLATAGAAALFFTRPSRTTAVRPLPGGVAVVGAF